jgi:hypothetical protein
MDKRGAQFPSLCCLPQWLVIGSSGNRIQLGLDHLFELANPTQLWKSVILFLLVEDLFPIQIHFKPAICPWGKRNSHIATKGTKKLVRHPRGGRVMLSSDTIHDIDESFPLTSHCVLLCRVQQIHCTCTMCLKLCTILGIPRRKSSGRSPVCAREPRIDTLSMPSVLSKNNTLSVIRHSTSNRCFRLASFQASVQCRRYA